MSANWGSGGWGVPELWPEGWTHRHHGYHLLDSLFTKLLLVHLQLIDTLFRSIWVCETVHAWMDDSAHMYQARL